jgi:hypothetical protein
MHLMWRQDGQTEAKRPRRDSSGGHSSKPCQSRLVSLQPPVLWNPNDLLRFWFWIWKVLVPVPFWIQTIFSTGFQQQKYLYKILPFSMLEADLYLKSWPLILIY